MQMLLFMVNAHIKTFEHITILRYFLVLLLQKSLFISEKQNFCSESILICLFLHLLPIDLS